MEISGKIIQVLPLQQGTSKVGNPWKKQEYVLETNDSAYPKKVKFDFFGDKVDLYPLNIGDVVVVSYDIESREFNGRWYTDIRAWKAEKSNGVNVMQTQNPVGSFEPAPNYGQATFNHPQDTSISLNPTSADESDDLPF